MVERTNEIVLEGLSHSGRVLIAARQPAIQRLKAYKGPVDIRRMPWNESFKGVEMANPPELDVYRYHGFGPWHINPISYILTGTIRREKYDVEALKGFAAQERGCKPDAQAYAFHNPENGEYAGRIECARDSPVEIHIVDGPMADGTMTLLFDRKFVKI